MQLSIPSSFIIFNASFKPIIKEIGEVKGVCLGDLL